MIIYYLFILVDAVMPPKKVKRDSNRTTATKAPLDTQEALAAARQLMQQELATLRQATPTTAATTVTASAAPASGAISAAHTAPSGVPQMAIPISGISLMQCIGMKLDSFDGSGSPVDAADWLTYVKDKMEVFEVVSGDRVRYGTQLLKGEAQIWWRGVQSSHVAPGSLSWQVFVTQFERRFYPTTFLEKMKIDLHNYKQEKMSVTEYDVGFNEIVHFVPHVACDEVEKAGRFRQGLKPSITHTMGAFPLIDFRTAVEQALGVEMQQQYTHEMQKSSGTDNSRSQDDKKEHSSGPVHKKDKSHRHQPYRGKSAQSSALGGATPQYRAIPKPGMGLVCFQCGDAHRRAECQWTRCSLCS
jgi:hypothetical protein